MEFQININVGSSNGISDETKGVDDFHHETKESNIVFKKQAKCCYNFKDE